MNGTSFSAVEHLQSCLTCISKIQCYFKRIIFPVVDVKYLFMCPEAILLLNIILSDLTYDVWKVGKVEEFSLDWRPSSKICLLQELVVMVIK